MSVRLFTIVTMLLLASCTTDKTTAKTDQKPAAQEAKDYVAVNSMGSWIPRKVKKADDLAGDQKRIVGADALEKIQTQGLSNVAKDTEQRAR